MAAAEAVAARQAPLFGHEGGARQGSVLPAGETAAGISRLASGLVIVNRSRPRRLRGAQPVRGINNYPCDTVTNISGNPVIEMSSDTVWQHRATSDY
jgi:hypothetical protein